MNPRAFRMTLEGRFEDGFVYMGQLLAVREDRTLVQADIAQLLRRCFQDIEIHNIAEMFLLRNDFMEGDGPKRLLRLQGIRRALESLAQGKSVEVDEDEWVETDDFSRLLPEGDVLDLHVYAQRLFAATTHGMLHSDLIKADDQIRLSPAVKRTDARCLSVTARSGSVIASCGDDGLLLHFDEFNELRNGLLGKRERLSETRSLRASWLGYHLINYSAPAQAEAFRSRYETVDRRAVVITDMRADPELLAVEMPNWSHSTFTYNNYSEFFSRYDDGSYELRERNWASGRLGKTHATFRGRIAQPISAHYCLAGVVVETFDKVQLVSRHGVSTLFEGQALAVRTFPSSRHYKNLVLIVEEDALHLISPLW